MFGYKEQRVNYHMIIIKNPQHTVSLELLLNFALDMYKRKFTYIFKVNSFLYFIRMTLLRKEIVSHKYIII